MKLKQPWEDFFYQDNHHADKNTTTDTYSSRADPYILISEPSFLPLFNVLLELPDHLGIDLLCELYLGERPEDESGRSNVVPVCCDDLIVGFKLAL